MSEFCPDVFVLGAPKCGTSTLAHWLKAQEGVFIPSVKEPNYFNNDEVFFASHTDSEYENLYASASIDQLLCDATPWYLASSVAIEEIYRRNTSAKFIILVRDQVELACALHQQEFVSGNEDIEDFETAWNLQKNRKEGVDLPAKCYSEKRLQYFASCRLGVQIEKLSCCVPMENMLVVSMYALKSKPASVKQAIGSLLNLKVETSPSFPVLNARKVWRSPVWLLLSRVLIKIKKTFGISFSLGLVVKAGQKKSVRSQPNGDFLEKVDQEFLEDKKLLNELLNMKLQSRYIK